MHYVESVSIVLLDDMDFKITGKEAQRIYQELNHQDFSSVRIELNEQVIIIPRESIVYIVFRPNRRANRIQNEIDQTWEKVFRLTGVKDDDDADWYVQENITYLGYRKVSDDPKVADLLIRLEYLQEQLESILFEEGEGHSS
ncbi:hypothetical protein [Thermoflavimicrobium daqui]|uniref:Uncharacterized protein n=1 Tax=Thermoflavimicrobium daqui TaxID=2137476 RepID=A0A364K131_9BACL|nr:hypothetical protein [Thermoflavimicrobium daqui]RAL21098.1 hypothetical protein DL897_17180 [Thermoflavimicrobium daqui]